MLGLGFWERALLGRRAAHPVAQKVRHPCHRRPVFGKTKLKFIEVDIMGKRFWWMLASAVALLAGCGKAGSAPVTPTVFWLPTLVAPTATPTPELQFTPPPGEDVLFFDDFSHPEKSPWPVMYGPWGAMGYVEGGYRITVSLPQTDVWAVADLQPVADVRVEVDAVAVSGSEYNSFGVLCRYQDDQNFYFFVVSNAGYYAIVKKEAGEQYQLTSERQFARRDVIRPGGWVNRVQGECVGDVLRLYVNDVLLAEVRDERNPLPAGDVGLLAGSFTDAGVIVHFDNFLVLAR